MCLEASRVSLWLGTDGEFGILRLCYLLFRVNNKSFWLLAFGLECGSGFES